MQVSLLHIADISNPRFESQIESVDRILEELGLGAIPRLLVLNKVDRIAADVASSLVRRLGGVAVSALHPERRSRLFWRRWSGRLCPQTKSGRISHRKRRLDNGKKRL